MISARLASTRNHSCILIESVMFMRKSSSRFVEEYRSMSTHLSLSNLSTRFVRLEILADDRPCAMTMKVPTWEKHPWTGRDSSLFASCRASPKIHECSLRAIANRHNPIRKKQMSNKDLHSAICFWRFFFISKNKILENSHAAMPERTVSFSNKPNTSVWFAKVQIDFCKNECIVHHSSK